jgi:hypothetical protein
MLQNIQINCEMTTISQLICIFCSIILKIPIQNFTVEMFLVDTSEVTLTIKQDYTAALGIKNSLEYRDLTTKLCSQVTLYIDAAIFLGCIMSRNVIIFQKKRHTRDVYSFHALSLVCPKAMFP